jgi:coenzyme F420-reducing hydrogenase beta subunit
MPSLEETTQKIRETAKRLLKEGKAELVIGFRRGTVPLTTAPLLARTEEDCDNLVWSNFCRLNLANYLPGKTGKTAIIAKGCDARSAVGQVSEHQIARENLYVVGIPCSGMIDNNLVYQKEPRPIREAEEKEDSLTVKGDGFSTEIKKEDVLRRNCLVCAHRTPKTADELLGSEVQGAQPDDYKDILELREKTPAERMEYFRGLIKDCLRCYACRNACPLCYCPVCFVDETRPQWLGKSTDPMDTLTFHLLRGLHCSGRCTACGSCETACPVNIKVREFNRVTEQTVQSAWGYEAGLDWEQKPPLTVFQPGDEAGFIK